MAATMRSKSTDRANLRRWLLAIVLVAVVARVGAFTVNHPFPPLAKDDSVYDALGWNLLNGHGFSASPTPPYEPVAYRTPGYPAFLATTYAVAGHHLDVVRLVQILVSLGTLVVVYLLAKRLMSTRAAVIAAGAFALCPAATYYPSLILSESNQAFLLAIAIYLAYRVVDEPQPFTFIALALVLAAATLCRPDSLLLIVLFTTAILLVGRRDRPTVFGLALAWVCFAAAIAPWMYRNYVTFKVLGLAMGTGHAAIIAKLEAEGQTGPALYRALEYRYGAAFQARYGRPMTFIDGALPDQDALRRKDFLEFVKAEPLTYARQSLARVQVLWQPRSWSEAAGLKLDFSEYRSARRYDALVFKTALLAWDCVFIGFAGFGVAFALMDWRRFALLLVPIAYASLIHGLIYSSSRYRVPLMPVIVLFATYGFLQVFLRIAAPVWRPPTEVDWQMVAGKASASKESVPL
jgi:4-amino-4-deoxy-L-arabinose transferase-like glycosyltransferase